MTGHWRILSIIYIKVKGKEILTQNIKHLFHDKHVCLLLIIRNVVFQNVVIDFFKKYNILQIIFIAFTEKRILFKNIYVFKLRIYGKKRHSFSMKHKVNIYLYVEPFYSLT